MNRKCVTLLSMAACLLVTAGCSSKKLTLGDWRWPGSADAPQVEVQAQQPVSFRDAQRSYDQRYQTYEAAGSQANAATIPDPRLGGAPAAAAPAVLGSPAPLTGNIAADTAQFSGGFPSQAGTAAGAQGAIGEVTLTKALPTQVKVNRPFEYIINIHNQTGTAVHEVVVRDEMSTNFRLNGADPAPQTSLSEVPAVWKLGSMVPNEKRQIIVQGIAIAGGPVTGCATVTYIPTVCSVIPAVEPKLKLTKTAPKAVLTCDPIPTRFVVTNEGTGVARNVRLIDELPPGMTTMDGQKGFMVDLGDIPAGESRQAEISLRVSGKGRYENTAIAQGADDLEARATTVTTVSEAKLEISKDGPAKRYIGHKAQYIIKVINRGNATANDVVIEDTLPAGCEFISASKGAQISGSKVTWRVPQLPPNYSTTVQVTVRPTGATTMTQLATATARCAAAVDATIQTKVQGIPAILLEVVDVEDPIEVGGDVTYVITVTNQGSAPGTNIVVTGILEDTMRIVATGGATNATQSPDGRTITFAPLAYLAPKQRATWELKVKAVGQGDVRMRVKMQSEQISRPVIETEATNFYDDGSGDMVLPSQ